MLDSKKTSQSTEQGLSDTKKLFDIAGGIKGKLNGVKPSTFSFTKKAGNATLKVIKWAATSLASTLGTPVLAIVVVACMLTFALTSVLSFSTKTITDPDEFNKSYSDEEFTKNENVFGAVCSATSTETYQKISVCFSIEINGSNLRNIIKRLCCKW